MSYTVFLWVTHFDPEDVIQQPVDGFILMKHQKEFHNSRQVRRTEKLPCKGKESVLYVRVYLFQNGSGDTHSVYWASICAYL